MDNIGTILGMIVSISLLVLIGIAIYHGPQKNPTWKGIIISALLGLLVFYLILCFLGWMGEERNRND